MTQLSTLIESEIADFFAGFGGPGEPDIQSGEAQRLLTERINGLLAAEAQEPMAWLWTKNDGERDVTLTNPADDEDAHDAILAGWSYRLLYAAPQPVAVPLFKPVADVARAALDYIDALPSDVVAMLPVMPGFDRDWAEEVLNRVTPQPVAVPDGKQ